MRSEHRVELTAGRDDYDEGMLPVPTLHDGVCVAPRSDEIR